MSILTRSEGFITIDIYPSTFSTAKSASKIKPKVSSIRESISKLILESSKHQSILRKLLSRIFSSRKKRFLEVERIIRTRNMHKLSRNNKSINKKGIRNYNELID